MSPMQREARIKHRLAIAHRRMLEEVQCESILEDWDVFDRASLGIKLGEARIREAVAEVQARQLGVEVAA